MNSKTTTTAFSMLTAVLLIANEPTQAMITSIQTETSMVTQLTDFQSTAAQPYASYFPSISKDGSTVVFVSDADLTGQGTNPDNLPNLFVMNSDGSELRQLTFVSINPTYQNQINYSITEPSLSANGSVVVFSSSNNLLNDKDGQPLNPPLLTTDPFNTSIFYYAPHHQIFIMNTDGSGLRQLTSGPGDAKFPRISNTGDVIAFQSSQNLVGENSDGNVEIYAIKADGSKLSQITTGTSSRRYDSRDPSISGDGSTIAFDSFIDLVPPLNDDNSDEIFVFDLKGFWRDGASTAEHSKYTVQITHTDIDDPYHVRAEDAFEPTLSYDGSWVAFAACINPDGDGILDPNRTKLGTNPFLPDVLYIAKRDGTEMKQLTFSDDPNAYSEDELWTPNDDDIQRPQISDDGRRIVFASRSRVDIVNPNNFFEIAMIDLDAPLGPEGRPEVEQLTHTSITTGPYVLQLSFDNTDSYKFRISTTSNASKTIFRAGSDFTGGNPDGSTEVFMVEPNYISATNSPINTELSSTTTDNETITGGDIQTNVSNMATESGETSDDKMGGLAAFGIPEMLFTLVGLSGLGARRRH